MWLGLVGKKEAGSTEVKRTDEIDGFRANGNVIPLMHKRSRESKERTEVLDVGGRGTIEKTLCE